MENSLVGNVILLLIIIFSLIIVFKCTLWLFRGVGSPNYHVISKYKNMEIREYPLMIRATVKQQGNRQEAISQGFSRLAAFILGKNEAHQKIKMTAPVIQEKIESGWQIQFIMPAFLMMDEISKPLDKDIQLIETEEYRVASIRFSGQIKEKRLDYFMELLQNYLHQQGCKIHSPVIYAFYNPPWTLPFMRRNEVWFIVDRDCRF